LAQNSLAQVKRIKALADRDSIPVVVVFLPDENQVNPYLRKILLKDKDQTQYDFNMPQSMLVSMYAENGIITIDLLPHFRNDSRCLYMNDTHWTPEGHRLAASVIYQKIREKVMPNNQSKRNSASL
jgi:hypothetical protein